MMNARVARENQISLCCEQSAADAKVKLKVKVRGHVSLDKSFHSTQNSPLYTDRFKRCCCLVVRQQKPHRACLLTYVSKQLVELRVCSDPYQNLRESRARNMLFLRQSVFTLTSMGQARRFSEFTV